MLQKSSILQKCANHAKRPAILKIHENGQTKALDHILVHNAHVCYMWVCVHTCVHYMYVHNAYVLGVYDHVHVTCVHNVCTYNAPVHLYMAHMHYTPKHTYVHDVYTPAHYTLVLLPNHDNKVELVKSQNRPKGAKIGHKYFPLK